MRESILAFWNCVGRRKGYWIPTLFFAVSTFGYSIFNRTVDVDDLAADVYIGSGKVMIAAGRWGMNLWHKLVAVPRLTPASDRLLAACFLTLAGVLLSSLFFQMSNDRKNSEAISKYTILTCSLITAPILGEIWEYTGSNYMSTGGMLISVVACYYLLTRKRVGLKETLLSGGIMTLPMASYESGVLFYITLVCAILYYKYCVHDNHKRISLPYLKSAVQFAIPLVIALCLRVVVGHFLRLVMGIAKGTNGATGIAWKNDLFMDVLRKLVLDTYLNYVINGIVYLPITLFLLATFFFVGFSFFLTIKKKNGMILIAGIILVFSVFLLPIVQGTFLQYRAAISLPMLVSFALFCAMECLGSGRDSTRIIVSGVVFYMIWVQSAYLNSELALNNQRSDNEMRIMSIIAQEILEKNTDKPVIFVGEYEASQYFKDAKKDYLDTTSGRLYLKVIDMLKNKYGYYYYTLFHITQFPDTNVNSVINYSVAVEGMMEKYLSYLGYDIPVIDRESNKKALALAQQIIWENNIGPYQVFEAEEFVIATLEF